jgi:hypothetical protein
MVFEIAQIPGAAIAAPPAGVGIAHGALQGVAEELSRVRSAAYR